MTRSFALWAGGAAVAAVIVAAVTIAAFPRESQSVQLPANLATPRPAPRPPVPVIVDVASIGRTTVATVTVPRGGRSAAIPANRDAGSVGFINAATGAPTRAKTARLTPNPGAKHVAKRQTSIGATSGPNGDSGLAASGASNVGASSQGPGPAPGVG